MGPLDQTVQLHAKLITLDINVKIHVTVRRMKSAINTSVAKWLVSYVLNNYISIFNVLETSTFLIEKKNCSFRNYFFNERIMCKQQENIY